jgi:hypothetical protein
MKRYRAVLVISVGLVCMFAAARALAGQDIGEGMHGMRWGAAASTYGFLTKVRQEGPVTYYVNANSVYQSANQIVPGVVYGFYDERFFAVYIKLRTPDQFIQTRRHFSSRYGPPEVFRDAGGRQSVYRWKAADVKIKLKMDDATGDIKLAVYYAPLSSERNEKRLEAIPETDFAGRSPQGGQTAKPAPLLDD